jgi:hypothetical protein
MPTGLFNPDGRPYFRSKLQICVALPSFAAFLLMLVILLMPLLSDVPVKSYIEIVSATNYGFEMITNKTLQIEETYSSFYYLIYKTFSKDTDTGSGIVDFYHEKFDLDFFTHEFEFRITGKNDEALIPKQV